MTSVAEQKDSMPYTLREALKRSWEKAMAGDNPSVSAGEMRNRRAHRDLLQHSVPTIGGQIILNLNWLGYFARNAIDKFGVFSRSVRFKVCYIVCNDGYFFAAAKKAWLSL